MNSMFGHEIPGTEMLNDFLAHITRSNMNLELVIKSHCYTPIYINNTSLQVQYGSTTEY